MISFLLVVVVLVLSWMRLTKKPDNFPPGPYRWPLVGNLREFKRNKELCTYEVIGDIARRYGKLVGIYLGMKPVIIVSGLSEIKEILGRPDCQDRPHDAKRIFEKDVNGLLFSRNPAWQEQRRFALRHFRDLGVGKRAVETLIHEEIVDVLQDTRKMAGKDFNTPVSVKEILHSTGANVIYHLLAGERFKRGDPELVKLLHLIDSQQATADSSGGIINSLPFLLKYAPWLTPYAKSSAARKTIKDFFRKTVDKHESHQGENMTYIDFYLEEIRKQTPDSSFHMKQLLAMCIDFFLAGSDTTVGALHFALVYMLREPQIQAKVHAELDEVVGRDRLPNLEDKPRMPYVNATLLETLRIGTVAPLGVAHTATQGFTFRSYFIPKETRIIINLFGLLNDKEVWGDPENFRPERFLDADGQLINHEAMIPFGIGKRACAGESMAKTNLFLTFTALLQNFVMSIPVGEPVPSARPIGGITLTVSPFNVKLSPRT